VQNLFDGAMARVHKQQGELVGGVDSSSILTLVQLDPLIAEFHLSPFHAERLDQNVRINLHQADKTISGTVTFISSVIEAQSGTILVKVELTNPDGVLVSGSRVSFDPAPM